MNKITFFSSLILLIAVYTTSVVVYASTTVAPNPNPIFYQKSFTVTQATTCGPSLTIPLSGFNNILAGWTKFDATLTQTPGLTIPQSARIYSIGITGKIAVPSGQWNFLTASATVAGLTGRLIPKGGFCSSCGTTASVGASTDEIITVQIGEPIPDDVPPKTFIANGNIFTNVFADGNGAPQPIPVDSSRIYPNPLNLDNVPTASSTLWSGIPFLPSGTLDTTTVVGTVSLSTGDNSYPVCWNSMTLDVRVILCPANTLANSDHPENPSPLQAAPAVNNFDESYRGSFITWRQDIPSASPVPTNTDSVQIDVVTSWAKGTAATPTSLSNLRLDVLSVPTSGTPVNLLSTNLYLIDQNLVPGATTTAIGFGTLWGSLASVGAATGTPTTTSFPWDRDSTAPVLSYDTYVKSIFLTIPGRVSVASARQIRVVISGCCRPFSLMVVDNNTPANPAPSTPTSVIPSAAVPYSIEAIMTLEHPAASAANPLNPVFPRSSPEVFVPPIIFLGGSPAPGATADSVAFGGFVAAGLAETGTTYGFSISEVAATNTQNTLLTGATTSFLPAGAGPYRSILLQAKMLDLSTFSTSGAVIPKPLAGTTVRGVLTQTNAANQLISSTTYDFLAIRRTTDIDSTVDENVSCNLVTNDGLSNFWNAFTGTTLTAGATGAATPIAIAGPDAILQAQTQINYEFAFALNKQCGNQLTVKPLRTGSQVYQTAPTTTLGAANRPANTFASALFFLANDATDSSNPVLPVFIKTSVGTGYTPARQALAGLEVLAVGLIGFNNRPTAVSQTYPSGTKSFSRERMGVSYCYARPYFSCPTGGNPVSNSVTAATCISPYTESTTCTGSVQITITSARTPVAFGTYVYKVLLLTLDGSSTVVNAVYQTATSTAGGAPVVITFSGVKPPPTGGSLSYYTIDPYGCPISAAITTSIYPATAQSFAVTLQSQVEPGCVAGVPTGGSATFLITGPAAAPTLQVVTGAGLNYQLAPGVTLPTAATAAVAVAGLTNTYTWTTPNFFAAAVGGAVPVITLQVATGSSFTVSVPFQKAIGTAVITFTIALNNNYVAAPVNLAGGVPGAGYTFQWYQGATATFGAATALTGATAATYQVTVANQGQFLFLQVTDSLGCTGVVSYAVAGAGTAPAVVVTPTVAISPAFSDSCAKINLAFAVTGTPTIPTGTVINVSHSRCLALVNPALPTTAANCATWTTFSRITCNYDIVTYPPISNTLANDVLIQYYVTIGATVNTPPVSTTAYATYTLGTTSYSVVQSSPPSCGSTAPCTAANPNYPRVP